VTLLLDEIRTYLIAQGVVGSTAWPIYEGQMVDDQNQMVAIFETGGFPSDTLGRENLRATFQVRIRCNAFEYAVGRNKCDDILATLQDAQQTSGSPVLLSGFVYIQALSEAPSFFGDDGGRCNFTLNFRVLRRKS
jgi:hypothetical protein